MVLCKSPCWRAGPIGRPILKSPLLFFTTKSFSSQVEEHNGHIFKATQYSIPTYCEYCSSLIWIMDRASVCKCKCAPFDFLYLFTFNAYITVTGFGALKGIFYCFGQSHCQMFGVFHIRIAYETNLKDFWSYLVSSYCRSYQNVQHCCAWELYITNRNSWFQTIQTTVKLYFRKGW